MTDIKPVLCKKKIKINFLTDISVLKKKVFGFTYGLNDIYLKVLLYLLCENVEIDLDPSVIAGDISTDENIYTEEDIIRSVIFWDEKNILKCEIEETSYKNEFDGDKFLSSLDEETNQKPEVKSEVSIVDISEKLESDSEFRRLVHESQIIFKMMFNPEELKILYSLVFDLKLEIELLFKLFEVLALENKRNLRYFEKVAIGLAENGIKTFSAYEVHYNEIKIVKEYEEKIKELFKTGDYKLKSNEKGFIKKWALEYKFCDEMIIEALEICQKKIQKIAFAYIHKILTAWYEKGFKSLTDIKNEFNAVPAATETAAGSSFNISQFFEKAVMISINTTDDGDQNAV